MEIDELLPNTKVAEIVAQSFGVSLRHAQERIMKRGDFPKPARQHGRRSVYLKTAVFKWLGVK